MKLPELLMPFSFLLCKCGKFFVGFDRCVTCNFFLSHISIPTFLYIAVNILLVNSHENEGAVVKPLEFFRKNEIGIGLLQRLPSQTIT